MHVSSRARDHVPQHGQGYAAGSIAVFGSGLAGLTAAVKLRYAHPDLDVLLVEKPRPESNTQLAGMRFRMGLANRRVDAVAEMVELLARRNDEKATAAMTLFAETLVSEMAFWQDIGLPEYRDRQEWFGPQWGVANRAGHGRVGRCWQPYERRPRWRESAFSLVVSTGCGLKMAVSQAH